MSGELKNLFSPIRINTMELKNRAVMPPMGTMYSNDDNKVSDRLVRYLARRAQGGTGLIITEICAVDPRGRGFKGEIGIWNDDFIAGLARIPDAIHLEGGKSALQLHHAGRESFEYFLGAPPEAPSPIPSPILKQPCEEMSLDRIAEIIEAFGSAAVRAQKAGFDAVEIHGAHGYLLGQFMSPFSNQRTDEYGGSDENRARFSIEIVRAVRKAVGHDYPVLFRISTEELVPGGYDLKFTKWLAPKLVSEGVDAIHASVGVYSTPGNLTIPTMDTEAGFNLFRARAIKEVVDVPVIGVGRIQDPRLAEDAIERGDADLISFGRQHLADPDLIKKAQRGDFDNIRWCLACNVCIEREQFDLKPVACTINPECGIEYLTIGKAENPRRIWIIGAGPAGLSAALSALERGHQVEIFEREGEPGGQLRSASKPPNKEVFAKWVTWAMRQLENRGASIRFDYEITEKILRSGKLDAAILASGALPITPDIPGINGDNVFDARDILMGKVKLKGPTAVLGGGYVGMETADYLLERNIEVTILEMMPKPPVRRRFTHGYWLHQRLRDSGGNLVLGAQVTAIELDSVLYKQDGEEKRLSPISMIITAMGAKPENELIEIMKDMGIPYQVVGDAVSPRSLFEAVHEGDAAGREI
jgi:2,4-dienoyl-CoA reductase-like NADH-dependent reductase (Old Yellow Enzyme family)/thioredoxin reductase